MIFFSLLVPAGFAVAYFDGFGLFSCVIVGFKICCILLAVTYIDVPFLNACFVVSLFGVQEAAYILKINLATLPLLHTSVVL